MPLYTFRVRLQALNLIPRGSPAAEMNHHFLFDDDDAAYEALPALVGTVTGGSWAMRWLAVRGAVVHEGVMYRRSTEIRKTWRRLRAIRFSLDDWAELELPVPGTSGEVNAIFRQRPIWNSTRNAVLVMERTSDPRVYRRVYVGPVSAIAVATELATDIGGVELPGFSWLPDAGIPFFGYRPTGDYPYDPDEDPANEWRGDIADLAASHCFNMTNAVGYGTHVVPSWRWNTQLPIETFQASNIVADLRSRGSSAALRPPVTD